MRSLVFEGGGARPLAFLAVLIPLAITGHHTGVVAFATLIVISGPVLRWARRELAVAVAIASSALAILVTLAFIGSDIAQRADDADATRVYGGVAETWRDEAARYSYLSVTLFANPVRRGSVALIGLAVLAFVLRRRRERTPLDLASASLAVALVLLIATPSKWPWHFGALIGIAAVAVASETIRLRRDAADARGWSARPFVVVGAALLALVWASGIRQSWNADDLRSLDWTLSSSWFSAETIALGFGLLLAGAVFIAYRRARPLSDVPWQFATRAALVVTLPVTVFAIGMLAIDAAKTNAWTLTRQNLQTLRGDSGCGFADELLVPDMGSVRALSSVNGAASRAPAWLPPPPIDGVDSFALGPVPGGPVESPWYEVSSDRAMGLFISGGPGPTNALSLEWGRSRGDAVRSYGRGGIGLNDAFHDERALPWRFVLASELPQVPEDADAVRVVLDDRTSSGMAIGVTSPVSYTTEKLAGQLGDSTSSSLVHPTVVPYFPCARQPTIRNGVAQAPDRILSPQGSANPVVVIGNLSPFMGLLDMYPLERLSLADSEDPPTGLLAFGVVKRIPGAIEAPPNAATTSSWQSHATLTTHSRTFPPDLLANDDLVVDVPRWRAPSPPSIPKAMDPASLCAG